MVNELALTPIILCGGAGSRLWPMSRDAKPKQFHSLVNDKTLLVNTLERVAFKGKGLTYLPARIVGGRRFEELLVEQGETGSTEVERYVLEPPPLQLPLPTSQAPTQSVLFWSCLPIMKFPTSKPFTGLFEQVLKRSVFVAAL